MRRLSLIIISLVCLMTMAKVSPAPTVATWFGSNAGDPNYPIAGTGNWNGQYWNGAINPVLIPAPPQVAADEIKLTIAGTVCTVNTNLPAGADYLCKLSIASGAKLEIVAGGYLGIGQLRVGSGGSTATVPGSTIGYVFQTGGTLNLNDNLLVGRYGASTSNDNNGIGYYTISGGNIQYAIAATGNLIVGGAGYNGASVGTFTVIGDDANISPRNLYVGSDGVTAGGTGNLVFHLTGSSPGTVSAIDAETTVLDAKGPASVANLFVSLSSGDRPTTPAIVLVRNSSDTPVIGIFDSVTLNGLAGYYLTYTYNAETGGIGIGNDIALIPEPATIALFGLGLLALVRRPRRK